jgi:hypothetical protein
MEFVFGGPTTESYSPDDPTTKEPLDSHRTPAVNDATPVSRLIKPIRYGHRREGMQRLKIN